MNNEENLNAQKVIGAAGVLGLIAEHCEQTQHAAEAHVLLLLVQLHLGKIAYELERGATAQQAVATAVELYAKTRGADSGD